MLNKYIITVAMVILKLAMVSTLKYALACVVLFHCDESYDFLKMAHDRSKDAPSIFCNRVHFMQI